MTAAALVTDDGGMPPATALAPSGVLRVAINLGNPVLAQGTPEEPAGVSVRIAERLAQRLDVPLELRCVDAARHSLAAVVDGSADLAFLAVDPDRGQELAFTRPYVLIDGVYVVPADSPLHAADDVDREGVRVGVKEGSAYDLHLSRELTAAQVVRGAEGTTVFLDEGLEAGAGIRGPVERFVAGRSDLRVLEEPFMQIRQAVAVPRDRDPEALTWVDATLAELLTDGSVARWLEESGQLPTLAAPTEGPA